MDIFLVYPHQLFKNIDEFHNKKVILIEEPLFFTQYEFHIQKLVLHRASMKFYETYLKSNNIDVIYYEDESYLNDFKNIKDQKIYCYDVFDFYLEKKIKKNFDNINFLDNPNFLNVDDKSKFLHNFYKNRRIQLNILVTPDNKPLHGKWSFDSDNRKKIPKDLSTPIALTYENPYVKEAKEYCKKFKSVGDCKDFYYPVTFDEAHAQLKYFLNSKFDNFGAYQDAIVKEKSFLFHSNISSSLNSGLLDLHEVVNEVLAYDAPINSKEGFIRQIIGWREFMARIYLDDGVKMRNSNFFEFKNKMPKKILEANSKIDILDDCINKLNKSSYSHHIERLMVLGNLFLLLEIKPNDVHEFFMQYYIDAYDWVMVGNVYGMSGFSDGGSITTKPYISSSNYLLKMSDYSKKDDWCKIVDGLYWRFLYTHYPKFENNHRMKMQISLLKKMKPETLENHLKVANDYLNYIYS